MQVWTIQLGKWRLAEAQGIPVLNITLGSGILAFAPTVSDLRDYRLGQMSDREYRERYIAHMRHTYVTQTSEWTKLLGYQKMAVACYCPAGKFCHRHIFTELLQAHATRAGLPFTLQGELQ